MQTATSISSTRSPVPITARGHGGNLAVRVNDYLADVVASRPDRFQALAVLPSANGDAAARELERAVKTLGAKGAIL